MPGNKGANSEIETSAVGQETATVWSFLVEDVELDQDDQCYTSVE